MFGQCRRTKRMQSRKTFFTSPCVPSSTKRKGADNY